MSNNQNNNKVKLLIFNPSPRLIKQFETKVKLLNTKYDIYRVRFCFDEQEAYEIGRQYFLNNPEYTHFAILPDDLIVELHHVDKLVADLEANPNMEVLSGLCNFSCVDQNFFNTLAVIPEERSNAYSLFKNLAKYDYTSLLSREDHKNGPKGLRKVLFAAFSFTIANRNVMSKFGFKAIPPAGQITVGMGLDTLFYNNCFRSGIICWADYDVMMLHIKDIERNQDMTRFIRYADEYDIRTNVFNSPEFIRENVLLKAPPIN